MLFLAVLMLLMIPLHPKEAQRATGHTLNIASGGVLSTNTRFDVEVSPSTSWGGNPVAGGASGPVEAVEAEGLKLIVHNSLQLASPSFVARILRSGLELLPVQLPDFSLMATTANLMRQAQLPLGTVYKRALLGVVGPLEQSVRHVLTKVRCSAVRSSVPLCGCRVACGTVQSCIAVSVAQLVWSVRPSRSVGTDWL